jgi:hypothetical protein
LAANSPRDGNGRPNVPEWFTPEQSKQGSRANGSEGHPPSGRPAAAEESTLEVVRWANSESALGDGSPTFCFCQAMNFLDCVPYDSSITGPFSNFQLFLFDVDELCNAIEGSH